MTSSVKGLKSVYKKTSLISHLSCAAGCEKKGVVLTLRKTSKEGQVETALA